MSRARGSAPPARNGSSCSLIPVALVTSDVSGPSGLEVVLSGGRAIRIHGDFDAAILRKAVRALEEITEC